jgi:aminoglycoside 6-adenylyltransferase
MRLLQRSSPSKRIFRWDALLYEFQLTFAFQTFLCHLRTEAEMLNLILHTARSDERVRVVLLLGSRADANAKKDILQDFDIVYLVNDYESFLADKTWIDVFGERLIMQLPDEMTIGDKGEHAYHYLMLFKDGNRIDLALFPAEKWPAQGKPDEPYKVLLDKDNLFEIQSSTSNHFTIQPPTQKEFADCCNEFWWVSTYVAKGLWRNEIIYANAMMEGPVRSMFLQLIEWHIGAESGFSDTAGKNGRHIKRCVSPELYQKILLTYPGSKKENVWEALFLMAALFDELATAIAMKLSVFYNSEEGRNAMNYMQCVFALQPEK